MKAIFAAFALFMLAAPALAASDGIAAHGTAALQQGFDHLPYVNPSAPKGGQLRLALVGTFDTLNPFIVKGSPPPEPYYNRLQFESLMYRSADEPFAVYPWLAAKADMAADRSAITFHLNPAARWADGKPVMAADVIFSWQTLKAKGRPNARSFYARMTPAAL